MLCSLHHQEAFRQQIEALTLQNNKALADKQHVRLPGLKEDDNPTCLKESGPCPDRLLAGSTGEMEMVAIIVIGLMPLRWLSENLISVTD